MSNKVKPGQKLEKPDEDHAFDLEGRQGGEKEPTSLLDGMKVGESHEKPSEKGPGEDRFRDFEGIHKKTMHPKMKEGVHREKVPLEMERNEAVSSSSVKTGPKKLHTDLKLEIDPNSPPLDQEKDENHPTDIENRDPLNLHGKMKLNFENAFGEPEPSVFSFDCVWKYSRRIFDSSKFCWYKFISVMCALPTALCWGLCYASFAYFSIWCMKPCYRMSGLKKCLDCCINMMNAMQSATSNFIR